MSSAISRRVDQSTAKIAETAARLRHPRQQNDENARLLALHANRLLQGGTRLLQDPERRVQQLSRTLETLSFNNVLARGYAVVRGPDGHVITKGADLAPDTNIRVLFGDQVEITATTGKSG